MECNVGRANGPSFGFGFAWCNRRVDRPLRGQPFFGALFRLVVFLAADAFFVGAALALLDSDALAFLAAAFGFAAVVDLAAVDLALADLALADLAGAALVLALVVDDFVLVALRDDDRLLSSPIGNALPTALTAPLATSPTVPATLPAVFPAVRPTCFMILAGSGIGRPPFVRPVARRSSEGIALSVPMRPIACAPPIYRWRR